MKTTTAAKPAAQKPTMPRTKLARKTKTFTVETQVSPEHHWAFNHLCRHYHLPLERILECEAYGQAETLTDDLFAMLEQFDDRGTPTAGHKVTLTFCADAHALLSRLAELLRRPLPELLAGLLADSGDCLQHAITDSTREPDGMDSEDIAGWADRAIQFERFARRNIAPGTHFKGSGWTTYNLTPPAVRAVKKGGEA